MAKRLINNNELRDNFLFENGITRNQILVRVREINSTDYTTRELFAADKNGDMRIIYPNLDMHLQWYNDNGKKAETYRIRKALPYINNQGQEVKYVMAPKSNICAFFPPEMLDAYKTKTEIPVLIVTEGEKKAFAACKRGFDCIGISGIWCYKDKDDKENLMQGKLLSEITEFIKVCKVKRVVLLHDSDALDMTDISKQKNMGKPLTDRPVNFSNSARYFCELIFQEGIKFSYSYINPKLCGKDEKLGLDDLLIKFEDYNQRVLKDFMRGIEEGTGTTYFNTKHISQNKEYYWKEIFQVHDPKDFYAYHKNQIAPATEFKFLAQKFKINVDGSLEEIKTKERDRVWVSDGQYVGEDAKGFPRVFTNFTMNVLFLLQSRQSPKRIIFLKNVEGKEVIKEMTMDDLVSVNNLRKALISEGNFIYKGDTFELMNLHQMLFKDEKLAITLTSLGYQRHYDFYAFANGITKEGKFYPIDEYGIVKWENNLFYLPAYSCLHKETDEEYENERKFKHIVEHDISFEDWAVLFIKVYKQNGYMGICFFVAALFRDFIYGPLKEFPILSLTGQKGSGKSTMAKSIMAMFGIAPNPMNIEAGSSTMKAMQRKFAQFKNAIVWIDEYKNEIDKKQVGMLKGLYDGTGYERANTSQDNRTTSTPVTSSTIISGQDMPTVDPALMSRVLLGLFAKNQFTQEEVETIKILQDIEAKGVSSVTVFILAHRELVKQHYQTEFRAWVKYYSDRFKKLEILDRLWKNVCYVVAPICILVDHNIIDGQKTGLTRENLKKHFNEILDTHRSMMNSNQEKSVFWEIVEVLFEEGIITAEKGHFKFEAEALALRFTPVFAAYSEKFRRVYNKPGLDKNTLLNYLKNSSEFIEARDSIRFEGGLNTSGYLFKYSSLGINLVKNGVDPQPVQKSDHKISEPTLGITIDSTDDGMPY